MKALFTYAADVPLSRVLADHRRWLVPGGLVLAVNVLVLVLVVLPLRQSAASASTRATASTQALAVATNELKAAEALRDSEAQAVKDLAGFYAQVLPADLTAARRITGVKFTQLARKHDVAFQSRQATPETLRDSTLERLHVVYSLTGDWDDIRTGFFMVKQFGRLNNAIREVVAGNELRQKMFNLGFEPDSQKSPTESAQFIRSERQKWARLVKERNIKAE